MWDYAEALRYLLALPNWETALPGQRPRQDVVRPGQLFAALGLARPPYLSVIIAGTNGKGSTAAMLESILRAAAYPAALNTHPPLPPTPDPFQVTRNSTPPPPFPPPPTQCRPPSPPPPPPPP